MPKFEVITKAGFQDKRWQAKMDLSHARSTHFCTLLGEEFPRAAVAFPIAFAEIEQCVKPIALFGIHPGKNLYFAPNGQWLGNYVPAQFRKHPFNLVKDANASYHLAIDATSSCLVTDAGPGDPFFTEEGEPTEKTKDVFQFLLAMLRSESATQAACELLERHDLLVPWSITVKTSDGEKALAGLLHIDEPKLNALSAEALKEIQQAGALMLAMCQLLSEQHLPKLGQLAAIHAKAAPVTQAQAPDNDAFAGLSENGTLNLSGLR